MYLKAKNFQWVGHVGLEFCLFLARMFNSMEMEHKNVFCRKAEEGLQRVWQVEAGAGMSLVANKSLLAYGECVKVIHKYLI